MNETLHTLPDTARAAGVEYRTLHSWVERGLFQPAKPSSGTGYPAILTDGDVALCGLLGRLRRAGCGFRVLEQAVLAFHPMEREVVLHLGDGIVVTAPLVAPAGRASS